MIEVTPRGYGGGSTQARTTAVSATLAVHALIAGFFLWHLADAPSKHETNVAAHGLSTFSVSATNASARQAATLPSVADVTANRPLPIAANLPKVAARNASVAASAARDPGGEASDPFAAASLINGIRPSFIGLSGSSIRSTLPGLDQDALAAVLLGFQKRPGVAGSILMRCLILPDGRASDVIPVGGSLSDADALELARLLIGHLLYPATPAGDMRITLLGPIAIPIQAGEPS